MSGAAAPAEPASPGWLFWPFLLLVLSAPAALGANRPAAWSALALGLGLVLRPIAAERKDRRLDDKALRILDAAHRGGLAARTALPAMAM